MTEPGKHDAPRPSAAPASTLLYHLTSIIDRLEPAQLFPKPQPLEVELGSGDGSFIAQYAQRHPEHNFLGIERLLGRLRKLDRKGRRAGLTNLRALRIESGYFLEYLVPPQSVAALHIYFPDPWPKRKHRKNRLINERFTEIACRALVAHGVVYLRTDDQEYFTQMVNAFAGNSGFAPAQTPGELNEVITDFERGFQARGVATLRAAYVRLENGCEQLRAQTQAPHPVPLPGERVAKGRVRGNGNSSRGESVRTIVCSDPRSASADRGR